MSNNKATKVALLKLAEALIACEQAHIKIGATAQTIYTGIGSYDLEYVYITQGEGNEARTLYNGAEHDHSSELSPAAVDRALKAIGVTV